MADETLKKMILAKLPVRHGCPPQILELLSELNKNALAYHGTVTTAYRRLAPEKRREVMRDPRWSNADKLVRETLTKLRDCKINFFGFNSLDFCEAFVEVYKAYALGR